MTTTLERQTVRPFDTGFMLRIFYGFAALALASVAISIGGKYYGRSLVMAGHTDATTPHRIAIDGDVLTVPANAIRFEAARRDGPADRLDIYLHWPDMQGYTAATAADFSRADGEAALLFLRFERRMMSRDMSGRFAPIYSKMILPAETSSSGAPTLHAFKPDSGYADEALAVAGGGTEPFVARCLTGTGAEQSFAPCERDLHVGKTLSVTYRFPRRLLADWKAMDAAVRGRVDSFLRRDR